MKIARISVVLASLALTLTALQAQAEGRFRPLPQQQEEPPVTRYMVKLARGQGDSATEAARSDLDADGIRVLSSRRMSNGADLVEVDHPLSRHEARDLARKLEKSGRYRYVVPDRWVHRLDAPTDTRYPEQWQYQATASAAGSANFEQAWATNTGSPAVVVAIIDTGLARHNDIDTNLGDETGQAVPGYDFIKDVTNAADGTGRDADASDPGDGTGSRNPSSWHGTHVAGTIAALTNNALGVAGGGRNVRVMPVRVLGRSGGFDSDIIDAIDWLAGLPVTGVPPLSHVVKVINMSLGGGGACDDAFQEAIDNAVAAGITVVVAAGNEADPASQYSPASCNNLISVHANGIAGEPSYYSNYGQAVTLSAPGGDTDVDSGILSTMDGGITTPKFDSVYTYYEGTSMATPHVAAAAALLYSKNITLTPAQVKAALIAGTRPFPAEAGCSAVKSDSPTNRYCGAGLLDAALALQQVADSVPPDISPDLAPTPDPLAEQHKSTTVEFAEVTVTGINMPVTVSISGASGSFSIDGGPYTSSASLIHSGSKVRGRHVTSATGGTQATSVLRIGDATLNLVSTTEAIDSTPDPFTFPSKTGVALDSLITSAAVTVTGIDKPSSVTVSGGSYSIGCQEGAYTIDSGPITVGQTVCVQHQSAATGTTAVTTTLTIGGVSGSFTSTTLRPDTVPSRFSFRAARSVPMNTLVVSLPVRISGINSPSPISVSGGEFSIGCGVADYRSTPATIAPNASVCVRHQSAATPSTKTTTVLTVGGVSASFVSTTARQ